jgi:putative CocE/NonD family hydrolase
MTEWTLTGGRFGDGAADEDYVVFDPWRPTPSVGGHAGHPAGPVDRTATDARSDVLSFTSPPLDADLHLAGDVSARLAIGADAASFDVHAVLSEMPAGGGVFELTSGHRRLDAPPDGPLHVGMRAICARIAAGGRLRLSVAGGAFPAFAVNSGTGKPPAEERLIDQRIITLRLRHGAGSGSALILPVAAAC